MSNDGKALHAKCFPESRAVHCLQLNVAEAIIALKIKSLDDALGKAIQQMQTAQLKLAVLVRALAETLLRVSS